MNYQPLDNETFTVFMRSLWQHVPRWQREVIAGIVREHFDDEETAERVLHTMMNKLEDKE